MIHIEVNMETNEFMEKFFELVGALLGLLLWGAIFLLLVAGCVHLVR